MNINNLEKCFEEASDKGAKYVGVKIKWKAFQNLKL